MKKSHIVVIALIAALLGYVLGNRQAEGPHQAGTSPDIQENENRLNEQQILEAMERAEQEQRSRDQAEYAALEIPDASDTPEERSRKSEALFEAASSGGVMAQYEVSKLLEFCNEKQGGYFEIQLEMLAAKGTPDWYVDKLKKDADSCIDYSFNSLDSLEPGYWFNEAKNAGHPAAVSMFLGLVENLLDYSGTDALAEKVLLSKNGEAYFKLPDYLDRRDNFAGIYDESFATARNGAMLMLACHFGYSECDYGSRTVYDKCLNAVPMCRPEMGLLDYMERFEWTSEEASLYDVLFRRYLESIESGDASQIFADG